MATLPTYPSSSAAGRRPTNVPLNNTSSSSSGPGYLEGSEGEPKLTEQLPESDDDYQQQRFQLLAALVGKGEVGRVDVWKIINNQQLALRYERKSKGLLKMTCFTKLSAADKDLQKICRDGFDLRRDGGMEFATGVLTSIKPPSSTSLSPEEYTIVSSEVAVGRSLIAEDKNVAALPLPHEYNSFYVPAKPLDRNNDGAFDYEEFQLAASFDGREPIEYHHRYYIKDSAQVLPKFVIQFSFAHRAVMPPTPTHTHTRTSSASGEDHLEYFDPVLYKPLTVGEYRKTNGRKLQTISEAYAQAKLDYERPDALVKGRKDWVEQQLSELEKREQLINMNMAHVKEQIDETRTRCLGDLRTLSRTKYETLLGVEVELNRQKEHIAWMDVVMKKMLQATELKLKTCTPRDNSGTSAQIEFLRAWKCHTVLRNAAMRMKAAEMNVLQKVVPDMALSGGRDVKVWLDPNAFSEDGEGGDGSGGGAAGQSHVLRSLHNASEQGHFVVPPKPKHDLFVPTLQSIIDMESERIQHCLEAAKRDASIALPRSVTRSPLAGDRYAPTLASLLTAADPVSYTQLGGDPKEKFTGVMKTFVGQMSDKPQAVNLPSSPWQRQQSAAHPIDHEDEEEYGLFSSGPDFGDAEIPPAVPAETANKATVKVAIKPAPTPARVEVSLEVPVLEQLASRLPAFSMTRQLQARRQKLSSNKAALSQFVTGMQSLATSIILHEYAPEEALEEIYFSLPASGRPPNLKCVFNTRDDAGGLSSLVDKCVVNPKPSIILIHSGAFVFGAYLSHPIEFTGGWRGGPACFLFSATLGIKIPFHARNVSDAVRSHGSVAFLIDKKQFKIGDGDLTLSPGLDTGTCSLEHSFGLGLAVGSTEATCFLAGTAHFEVDQVEVFSVV